MQLYVLKVLCFVRDVTGEINFCGIVPRFKSSITRAIIDMTSVIRDHISFVNDTWLLTFTIKGTDAFISAIV